MAKIVELQNWKRPCGPSHLVCVKEETVGNKTPNLWFHSQIHKSLNNPAK